MNLQAEYTDAKKKQTEELINTENALQKLTNLHKAYENLCERVKSYIRLATTR